VTGWVVALMFQPSPSGRGILPKVDVGEQMLVEIERFQLLSSFSHLWVRNPTLLPQAVTNGRKRM
jgi:hypothetical protein